MQTNVWVEDPAGIICMSVTGTMKAAPMQNTEVVAKTYMHFEYLWSVTWRKSCIHLEYIHQNKRTFTRFKILLGSDPSQARQDGPAETIKHHGLRIRPAACWNDWLTWHANLTRHRGTVAV